MPRNSSGKSSAPSSEGGGADFPNREQVRDFRSDLIAWFRENGEDYPWRRTCDPYAILVSETMLQQTRIATVLGRGYYKRWMKRFPNLASLAEASEEEILELWQGLGYYNRARNLQSAAKTIQDHHGGAFPENLESILALPGVGRYTAGAVLSFAFRKRACIVDGNVLRVLSRWLGCEEPIDDPAVVAKFWKWAEELTPERDVWAYNSAIMELGQRVCVRSSPRCSECPVSRFCVAHATGATSLIPVKRKKKSITEMVERVGIVFQEGAILLEKESGNRRTGLWKLPEVAAGEATDWVEEVRFKYAITRFRVDLRVFEVPPCSSGHKRLLSLCNTGKEESLRWHSVESLPPLGAPYRKAIGLWLDREGEGLRFRE